MRRYVRFLPFTLLLTGVTFGQTTTASIVSVSPSAQNIARVAPGQILRIQFSGVTTPFSAHTGRDERAPAERSSRIRRTASDGGKFHGIVTAFDSGRRDRSMYHGGCDPLLGSGEAGAIALLVAGNLHRVSGAGSVRAATESTWRGSLHGGKLFAGLERRGTHRGGAFRTWPQPPSVHFGRSNTRADFV